MTALSVPTVNAALAALERLGIVDEVWPKAWPRVQLSKSCTSKRRDRSPASLFIRK
nr:hypothetical protein [Agrobacterium deltaense]